MPLLRILCRAALICNICFLIAIWIIWLKHPVNQGLTSIMLIMGFFISPCLNIVVNAWLSLNRVSKKPRAEIPRLIIFLNGAFLAIQLIIFLK